MGLLAFAFALVGMGALVVATKAITQLGQANHTMMCLLADNLAASQADQRAAMSTLVNDQRATRATLAASHVAAQEHLLAGLSRIQGSVGVSIADAVERVSTAIGAAVQTATTPVVAPLSMRDEAERAARNLVGGGYGGQDPYVEQVDDTDPTDHWLAPERLDAELVAPGARNPTGIPGFAFDGPDGPGIGAALPFEIPAGLSHLAPNGAQ